MLREDELDELLDAYEEAFSSLPVYKKNKDIPKMNTVDSMARDVAFEIILGGDRLGPDDLAAALEGCTRGELNLFKDRVRYHAVDFAPEQYRDEDFLSRSLDAWTRDISLSEGFELRQSFLDMMSRRERGLWFRFSDGQLRRCETAVSDAMWPAESRMNMDPKPVTPVTVAKEKAFDFLAKYGKEVMLDGPVLSADVLSYGSLEEGNVMSVRRIIDIVTTKPEDFTYFVTYNSSEGQSSTLLSKLSDEEIDRFIQLMENEEMFRHESEKSSLSERMSFPLIPGTVVWAPVDVTGVVDKFTAESLVEMPDGDIMVSGRFAGKSADSPAEILPLFSLSDKAVWQISRASEASFKQILEKTRKAHLNLERTDLKKKDVVKSRGVE